MEFTPENNQLDQPGQQPEPARKRYLCRHIHTAGHRCGSPSLRGENFCYYHHASRPQRRPDHDYIHPNSTFDLPSFEDRLSIQLALGELARRICQNQIDHDRARLLLRAIRIASINLPREPRLKTEPKAIPQVEEIELDSTHGPIAPVAEVPAKEERKGFAQLLLEELRARQAAKAAAEEDPQPEAAEAPEAQPNVATILPEIQAVAEPAHSSYLTAHIRTGRRHNRIKLTANSRKLPAHSKKFPLPPQNQNTAVGMCRPAAGSTMRYLVLTCTKESFSSFPAKHWLQVRVSALMPSLSTKWRQR
jgi:hypothetical protein